MALNRLPQLCLPAAFLLLISINAASARSHFVSDRTCTTDSDCRSPKVHHTGNDTICASGFCKCSDPDKVLGTVALNGRDSEFDGYYYLESSSICAPKVGQPCLKSCEPHAFCRHENASSTMIFYTYSDEDDSPLPNGTCTCIPNRSVSSTTGRCECDSGYEEHPKSGECLIKLPESCKVDSDCSADFKEQGLECSNSTCQCKDPTTIWETIRNSHAWTRTDSNGTSYSFGSYRFFRACLPKPGQACLGRKELCAPGAVCDWDEYRIRQYCKCGSEAVVSNTTGLCECPKHFKFGRNQRDSGDCFVDWETPCESDNDCQLPTLVETAISASTRLAYSKCINGTCGCNPENSFREQKTRWSIINETNLFVTRQLTTYGVGFQESVPYEDGTELLVSNETFCAIKPQAECTPGTSICAWGSRCTVNSGALYYGGYASYYTRTYSRQGKCTCLNYQKLNASTGYCECERNYYRDNVTDSCEYRKPEVCQLDVDCDRDVVSNTTLVCRAGKCICDPDISVWAKAQTSDINVDPIHPEFRGFTNTSLFSVTAELCAPKPNLPCARHGLCGPASYCVYISQVSWTGTCKCIPHAAISNTTGLCECLPGYRLSEAGICEGALLNQTCSAQRPCGIDLDSKRPLACIAGKCQCDPETSVYASVFTSNTGVHTDNPRFQGYSKLHNTSVALCAPKPGQKCAGRGFCAPNSYCVYRTIASWTGICECLPNMVINNSTGLCECPSNFELTPDGQCYSVVPDSCNTDSDCGADPVSSLPLVCLNNKCECEPTRSVAIMANVTLIKSLLGPLVYTGQKANSTTQEVRACALRQGKICGGTSGIRFCAPGTVCRSRYSMYSTTDSTCACEAEKIMNSEKGICECPPGSLIDSTGSCSPGVGRRCSYGYTYGCGVDPKSRERLECRNNICSCNPLTHEAKNEVVPVPRHPMVMRLASDKFMNITYCAAKPGTKCLKNNCIAGAFCADENLKATNETGVCICSPGTVFANSGALSRCISAYEAPCDQYKACTSGLYCINGQCRCQLKSQWFDTSKMTCVSKVGGPCHDTSACGPYSNCQDERCLCDNGFVENQGTSTCQRPFGSACEGKEAECGPESLYQCSNGRCECQSLYMYDNKQGECVGLVGASCHPKDGGRCVANAGCPTETNKCACEEGFKVVANGLCASELPEASDHHQGPATVPGNATAVSTLTIILYVCIALLVTVGLVGIGIFVYFRRSPGYPISINSSRRTAGSGEDYETLHEPDTNL